MNWTMERTFRGTADRCFVARVASKKWAKPSSSTRSPPPVPRFPVPSPAVEVPPRVSLLSPAASSDVHANDLVTLTFDSPIALGSAQVFVGSSAIRSPI